MKEAGIDRRSFLRLTAGAAAALALRPWPKVLARAERRDMIVVSNGGDGTGSSISLVDTASLEVLATLPMPASFSFPATRWDFERDLIWSGGPSEAVYAWRLSTGENVLELATGSSQNYSELTPDGRYLIVAARFADRFLKIPADPRDADFGRIAAEIESYHGASPCDMTLTSDGTHAYAPERGGHTLSTIDVAAFEKVSTVSVEGTGGEGLEPYMATASPVNNVLLVENVRSDGGDSAGSESVFDLSDPATPVEVARLESADGLGAGPITSEVSLDGRYGLVVCRDSSELAVIDTSDLAVVGSVPFPAGSNPLTGTFVYGSDGDRFFVPLPGRDAVAVVAVPEFELVELLPVGPRPLGIVHLRAPVPERQGIGVPLGLALAGGRTFPPGCPDRCCGPV